MKTSTHVAFFLVLIVLLPPAGVLAGQRACSVTPAALRCEYLHDPLGIDVTQPRLSWQLTATDAKARGQRQSGYRVLVASTKDLLGQGRGDLWDSGMVASDQSAHIAYDGKPLASGMACFWKVQVRDESDVISPWSEPARWTMGLLTQNDWHAQWFGADKTFERKQGWPPPDNDVPDPWLRKSFALSARPERATVYVASVGYHELYVNGKKVDDTVLAPSVVNYRKRARYVTYEIADHLREGKNVIGLWLGVSWSIFPQYKTPDKPQTPIVLAQAEIKLPGGKSVQIATDDTWRTHASPNTLLGIWDFMHFGGERYDARQEVADWCE
ncbi:MAG TPA: alpha-L-rhamnosidase N-terminal domain-containing protein, partial [Sedimentisphaerales bacterium]|nr:alpha-L-rhamnosidase N-terminal domain-containing protein [Sedimentisphaerales bacterium]